MPSVVIPDVWSASIDWALNGEIRMTNVLHFILANPVINQSFADAVATDIQQAFVSSNWEDEVATVIGLERVRCRSLDTANQAEWTGIINDDGLNAGTVMPLQNSVVVTLRTALAGRSYRGRVYLGGLTEAANGSNGAISTTTRDRAQAFIDDIGGEIFTGGRGSLCVASRKLLTANSVTSVVTRDGVWDTQRRRNRPTA